jgi:hypothetical protein
MHPRSESRRRRRNVWKLFTELMTDVSEVVAMLYQGAANGLETTAEIVVESLFLAQSLKFQKPHIKSLEKLLAVIRFQQALSL